MAQDVVSGLFGMSPYQAEQQRYAEDEARAARFAQMPAVQRGVQGLMQGGAGLARLGAGAMGMVDPAVQAAQQQEEVLKGIDFNNPQTIRTKAKQVEGVNPQVSARLSMLADSIEAKRNEQALAQRKQTFQEEDAFNLRREKELGDLRLREEALRQRAADNAASLEERKRAAQEANQTRLMIAQMMRDARIAAAQAKDGYGKPMPAGVVKEQNDMLDMVKTASVISNDMVALKSQIDSGAINLGPISNIANKVRNGMGLSTEESRNFSSFMGTLEKLRNDSLRLNKGTQTEGDAQRAWNELLSNISDQKAVSKRLAEIDKYNRDAAKTTGKRINQMRDEYGKPPIDVSEFETTTSPLAPTQQPSGFKIRLKGQ